MGFPRDAPAGDDYTFKLFRHDPSLAAAIVVVIVFIILTALHTYQMFRTRTWFLVPFVLGGFFEWIGYVARAVAATQSPNWSLGPYIIQTLLPLVAPALFAASIYMTLGRIVLLTDGESHALLKSRWLTKTFVCGDVLSFTLQAAGGGVMASGTLTSLTTGQDIIMVGLAVQVLFFSFFIVTAAMFHRHMIRFPTSAAARDSLLWHRHLIALYITSMLILVRSLYRLVEYGEGNAGYLMEHEVYLYIFDALLMAAVMLVFAWVHPSEINALLKGHSNNAVHHLIWLQSV